MKVQEYLDDQRDSSCDTSDSVDDDDDEVGDIDDVKTVSFERLYASSSAATTTTTTTNSDATCVICLLEIDIVNDCALLDSCPHIFHYSCIRRWSKVKSSCPQCRRPFIKVEKIENNERHTTSPNVKLGGFGLSLGYEFLWLVLQTLQFPPSLGELFIDKYNCSYKRAHMRLEEYRKFILLATISATMITPSKQIGMMWYLHFSTAPQHYTRTIELLRNAINVAWRNAFARAKPRFDTSPRQAFAGTSADVRTRYKKGLDMYINVFGTAETSMWPSADHFHRLRVDVDGDWPKESPQAHRRVRFDRTTSQVRHAREAQWHVCKNLLTKSLGVLLGAALLLNLASAVSASRGLQTMRLSPTCKYFVDADIFAQIGYYKWSYDNPEVVPNQPSAAVWGSSIYAAGICVWVSAWLATFFTLIAFLLVMLMLRRSAADRKLTRRETISMLLSFVCWVALFICSIAYQINFSAIASSPTSFAGQCITSHTVSYGVAAPWLSCVIYTCIIVGSQILSPHPRLRRTYATWCGCACVQARVELDMFGDEPHLDHEDGVDGGGGGGGGGDDDDDAAGSTTARSIHITVH